MSFTAASRPGNTLAGSLVCAVRRPRSPRILLAALTRAAMTIVAAGGLAHGDLASNLGEPAAAVAYATLDALIVRRAGNVSGWIMLGEGAASAFLALASIRAVIRSRRFPGRCRRRRRWGRLPRAASLLPSSPSRSCSLSDELDGSGLSSLDNGGGI
jgi:hypothetical protein